MIFTQTFGTREGMPTVLAHCFLGHSGSWKRMLDALPVGLDALAFDMPGHGRSPMPAAPGDFHAMVSGQIGGLVVRPSLLVGHSFGAASMLRHALLHPETVTGMVLIEPVFFAAARAEPEFPAYEASEQALRHAVAAGDLDEAARCFLALNEGSPDFDTLPAPVRESMAAQMPLVVATTEGLFGDSGGLLAPGVMTGFDKPVLLMRGAQTSPIFHATVRALARLLPRAEVAVIEGAGHMVPISHPVQTADAIAAWMQRAGLAADGQTEKPRVV
ncbi:MAG: alpha/beta hydrolase [Rhodobacteraceae bacterium]|nr:alpha/beta hydrolase [Paracoccaceae bacterium]